MKDIPAEVVERILEEVQVGLTLIDREGNLVWSNPVARRLFGWQQEEINIFGCHKSKISKLVSDKLNNVGFNKEWHRILRIDGNYIENVYSLIIIPEKFSGVMMFSRDVSEREKMLNNIKESSIHDSLTHLLNRQYFDEVYQELVKGAKLFGLIMLDVNGLKFVNDTYGHQAGDDLLIHASQILQACVREQDYVFRIGGDEFVIIVESNKGEVLDNICSRIRKQCNLSREHHDLAVSLSLGTCLSSEANSPEETLSIADKHMYEDKAKYYLNKKE